MEGKDYSELIRAKTDYKNKREEKYKFQSRDRLSKIIRKKIQVLILQKI